MLDLTSIKNHVRGVGPRRAFDYIYAFDKELCIAFDTETSLLKDGQNIYSDIPKFVLGVYNQIKSNAMRPTTNVGGIHATIEAAFSLDYIVVGHNIAFDLNAIGIDYIHNNAMIWDTALFHYVSGGQYDTFPSLEDTHKDWAAHKNAGTPSGKIKGVSEAIKAGVEPEHLPYADLVEYCEQDVRMTKEIFINQFAHFKTYPHKYQQMIINQMNWLKNIYNMSKNGLKLDTHKVTASIAAMSIDEVALTRKCNDQLQDWINDEAPKNWIIDTPVNCMSNKQLETILFGGEIKGYYLEEAGTYKTGSRVGQTKYKKIPHGVVVSPINWGPTVKKGSVDSTNIKAMLDTKPHTSMHNFLTNILELRDVAKTKGTYFEGYLKYVDTNGFIHSEMKHVGTPTGRLSSTKPNIQNLKGDE